MICTFGGFEVVKQLADFHSGLFVGSLGRPLIAAEIVHDDNIACRQCRHKALLDISGENIAIHGTADHLLGVDPIMA